MHHGFARVRCGDCAHEFLLAFSCKGRYFCPSCHQKRVVSFAEWAEQEVLEKVPHRQYVFTIPKMLRIYFKYDRKLLGKLSQCAYHPIPEVDTQKMMELFRHKVFRMLLAEEKITETHIQKLLAWKHTRFSV